MTPKCVAINRTLHGRVVNCVTQPHTYLCPLSLPSPSHLSYCLAYPFRSLCALVKVEPVVVVAVVAASAAELVSQQFSAICIGFFLAQVVEHLSWPPLSLSLSPLLPSALSICLVVCVALAAYVTKCH